MKIILKRLLTSAIIFSVLSMLIFPSIASALNRNSYPTYYDAKNTMYQKAYYNIINQCIQDADNFDWDMGWSNGYISNSKVNSGKIFTSDSFQISGPSDGFSSAVGWAVVEKNLTSNKENGTFWCGEGDNALFTAAVSSWGLDKWDIICDYSSSHHDGSGILGALESEAPCRENTGDYGYRTNRSDYLARVIKAKVFNGSPPGGSISSFTEAENYWFLRETLVEICTTGNARPNEDGPNYTIAEIGANGTASKTGYATDASYTGNTGVVTGVGGGTTTCSSMASQIAPGSAYANAAQKLVQVKAIDKCYTDYSAILTEQKDLLTAARAELATAKEQLSAATDAGEDTAASQTAVNNAQAKVTSLETDVSARESASSNRADWTFVSIADDGTVKCDVPDWEAPEEEAIESGDDASEPSCFDGGGALGWILCPVLEGLGDMADGLYNTVIVPFLAIDAELFTDNPDNGTYQAWTVFQGLANVVFIILILVVIFSQVTGVGIDNYGIKKILPKLIISAILINLSYIVCRLAVDISNILGYGLRQLFEGIAVNINVSGSFSVPAGANVATVIIGVLLGAAGIAAIATGGLAIILPLLLGMLSAAIAIFFIFILLGARQAGVVLLIVISPLAIVCYMLPNTKKLFDRWLKIFQGLLLLFPLCGLLMGASDLASRILLSTNSDNFWTGLVALLINVVPFFFLPTLLKASFAAMGNLGAKISGFGQGLRGKAQGIAKPALEKSRFGQYAQKGKNYREYKRAERGKYNQERYQYNKAQDDLKKYNERIANGEQLSSRDMNKAAIAARAVSGGDKQALDDAKLMLLKATNNGADEKMLKTRFDQAVGKGDETNARAIADIMGSQKFKAKSFGDWMNSDSYRNALGGLSDQQRTSMMSGIAKTMATGEGARNYRAANAFQFQHASDILSGDTKDAYDSATWADQAMVKIGKDGKPEVDSNGNPVTVSNAERAFGNHITNPNELYGQSKDVLNALASSTSLTPQEKVRLGTLAQRAMVAAESGQIEGDITKDTAIRALAALAPSASNSPSSPLQAPPAPTSPSHSGSSSSPDQNGNIRGNTAGPNGGRIIIQGPDAGLEQTDSGIIISH